MATYTDYGPWTSSGNRAGRLVVEHDLPAISPGQSSVTVTMRAYVEARYGFHDSSNSLSLGGDWAAWSGPVGINVPSGGRQLLLSRSGEFPLGDQARTITTALSLSGINYLGTTASISARLTLPGRAAQAPPAPASVTTTRLGDSDFRTTWSSVPGAAWYELQIWQESLQRWAPLGRFYGTSWDTDYAPDDQYRIRVQAWNAAGYSPWRDGNYFRSKPAAPRVELGRRGTTITIAHHPRARYPQGSVFEYQLDNEEWKALTSADGGTAVAAHQPPLGRQVRYAVRTRVGVPSEAFSDWVITPWTAPLAAPRPPRLLAPAGVADSAEQVEFGWEHQPVDLSAQTAAEVRWRRVGTTAWSTASVTTASTHRVHLTTGLWEWQARTRGAHADWSGWSAVTGFQVAARPTVTIQAPAQGAAISASRVTARIGFTDPAGVMASWTVTVLQGGQEVGRTSGRGAVSTVTVPQRLVDRTDYRLVVEATSTTGLTGRSESAFRTAFRPPPTPRLAARFEEAQGVTVLDVDATPQSGDAGKPPAVRVLIEASTDGVSWREVATLATSTGTVTDPRVPLGSVVTYRVTATSDLPSEAAGEDVTIGTDTRRVWIVGADGAAAHLILDIDLAASMGHEVVLAVYEGDALPTPHFGPQRDQSLTFSGLLTPRHGSPVEVWQRLLGQPVLWRDPTGRVWDAVLTDGGLGVKHRRGRTPRIDVSGAVRRIKR